MNSKSLVELRDVSLYHGKKPILHNLNFSSAAGVSLLYGANGAGKSSLLKLLAGLQTKATVLGQGQVLSQPLTPRTALDRCQLGYMPQQGGLYEELSALENLQFRATMLGIPQAQAYCLKVSDDFGLTPILRQRVAQLSGGWRQQLAFAATLLARPKLLLLDEPTAGVDLEAKARIWAQIDKERQNGVGIIISSHDPQEASQADRLIHLNRGRIEYNGMPDALTSNFELSVVTFSCLCKPAQLQELRDCLGQPLTLVFSSYAANTTRLVFSRLSGDDQQIIESWANANQIARSWTSPELTDGLRAVLLLADRSSVPLFCANRG